MIPRTGYRRWQVAIGPLADDSAVTLDDEAGVIDEAIASGKVIAITKLHLVNESEDVRTRVQVLSRGDTDTVIGLTACGSGDAGSDIDGSELNYLQVNNAERPGLKAVTTGASVVGFAIGYTW